MPQYIKNGPCDIDFLSNIGVSEYLEDVLSDLPHEFMMLEVTVSLFKAMKDKLTLTQIKELMQSVDWLSQPFELQAIAVGLKLFTRN